MGLRSDIYLLSQFRRHSYYKDRWWRRKAHGIDYKSWDVMSQMYKMLVRLQMETCVQFWPLYYRKDVIKPETTQKGFKG